MKSIVLGLFMALLIGLTPSQTYPMDFLKNQVAPYLLKNISKILVTGLVSLVLAGFFKSEMPAKSALGTFSYKPTQLLKITKREDYIGGIPKKIDELIKITKNPNEYQNIFNSEKGYIFSGKMGTGKTLLAHIIASEVDCPFFEINAADLGGMAGFLFGLDRLFQAARDCAKSHSSKIAIIFFDELHNLPQKRQAQLLTLIDGFHEKGKKKESIPTQKSWLYRLKNMFNFSPASDGVRIIVLGATSECDSLSEALKRSLRLKVIEIKNPDTETRITMVKHFLNNHMSVQNKTITNDISDQQLSEILSPKAYDELTQADIASVISETIKKAVLSQNKTITKDFLYEAIREKYEEITGYFPYNDTDSLEEHSEDGFDIQTETSTTEIIKTETKKEELSMITS